MMIIKGFELWFWNTFPDASFLCSCKERFDFYLIWIATLTSNRTLNYFEFCNISTFFISPFMSKHIFCPFLFLFRGNVIVRVEVQEGFYDVNCFPRSPLNLWTFMIFFLSQLKWQKNYDELLWPQNAFLQLIPIQKPRLTFFSQA